MPFGMKFGLGNKKDESINSKTSFKDVAGMEEVKQELSEIVDFLKTPEKKEAWKDGEGELVYASKRNR